MDENTESLEKLLRQLSHDSLLGDKRRICKSILRYSIDKIHPQIICLMLSKEKISYPIYDLLRRYAARCKSFRTTLFFALRSCLGTSDKQTASCCYYLCCELLAMVSAEQRNNKGILLRNYRLRHPEYFQKIRYNNTHFEVQRVDPQKMVIQRRRPLRRTQGLLLQKPRMPSFDGLWIFFARAVSCIISPTLFSEFDAYMRLFITGKSIKKLNTDGTPRANILQNFVYYDELVEISSKLRKLPQHLRQRALEVELELLNIRTLSHVSDPFDPTKKLVNILVDECTVLDSAENVPFILYVETVDKSSNLVKLRNKECCRLGSLWSHLDLLSDVGDVGDVNGIRENILEALEQSIFTRRVSGILPITSENTTTGAPNEENPKIETKTFLLPVIKENTKNGFLLHPRLQTWEYLRSRVSRISPLAHLPGWSITSFIIKYGSPLKFEYLSYQVISVMKSIFQDEGLDIFLRDYKIYLISERAGFVETVRETQSVHKIRATYKNLSEYYNDSFVDLSAASHNFLISLVGYSLASYVLQLKDRHNGNILIDGYGHILHVDFSFVFGRHPGFYCFENSPFKFSDEYLDIVDIGEFRKLFLSGFMALSRNVERIAVLIECVESQGLCDSGTAAALRTRLDGGPTEENASLFCKSLIDKAVNNTRTLVYDKFQYFSNGYY